LTQVDEETWVFKVTKSYYGLGFLLAGNSRYQGVGISYPKILTEGTLKAMSSGTTLVIGIVSTKRGLNIISLLLVCIAVAILLGGIPPTFSGTSLMIVLLILGFAVPAITISLLRSPNNDQRFVHAMKGHIKEVLGN
jgi:hypothetical protein